MKKSKSKALSIADILGIKQATPYDTTDISQYEIQIKRMNLLELQEHAIKAGLRPSHDRLLVEKALLNLFKTKQNTLLGIIKKDTLKIKPAKTIYDIIEKGHKDYQKTLKEKENK
jgi:hypothetical protein